MKTTMLFFLSAFLMLSSAIAGVEESCCFCVADSTDSSTVAECQRWMKDTSKAQNCTKKEIFSDHSTVAFEDGLSCRKVTAYGANHGLSYFYATVFTFARKAARKLDPVEIHYDGSTCLVFNNVEIVQRESEKLSKEFPQINFELTGNQNEGVVRYFRILGIGTKPKESSQMASKMTVHAQGGTIETIFGDCSKPKGQCGYAPQDYGATNDSNTKFCTKDNEVVSQKCCKQEKGTWGKWGVPGMECDA